MNFIINLKSKLLTLSGLFAVILLLASCSEEIASDEEVNGSGSQSVTISETELSSDGGSGKITYIGEVGSAWSAQITEGSDFLSFSMSGVQASASGEVISAGNNTLYFYYSKHTTIDNRVAVISFELEGEEPVEFSMTQLSTVSEDTPYTSALYAPRWTEIPTRVESDNYLYVTHNTTINGSQVRNFSLCFDIENRAAAWVAFPFHSCYDGDAGRNENWTYDPKIATSYQANLKNSYGSYNGNSYDRGHQMASADRQASVSMNQQTFYYSNMTPQLSSLNQGKWATFEINVRKQVCADTLFVVTGADFTTTIGSVSDASGNSCPLPGAYYKVLLRTRTGYTGKAVSECTADELQAIGFWFEHATCSAIPDPVSVQYIEDKTGFDFFPSVPSEVKATFNESHWPDIR